MAQIPELGRAVHVSTGEELAIGRKRQRIETHAGKTPQEYRNRLSFVEVPDAHVFETHGEITVVPGEGQRADVANLRRLRNHDRCGLRLSQVPDAHVQSVAGRKSRAVR